eukprot:Plantae.Rhodophyta-Hildenbrandia_rubra.ctg13639.p1 GENE.Plantae.Rhodophyta-Hildenbrandia_rubra.ctg13639~~Plantae.Rhodophyta-Hildenbrandia_rubra.ctg13639.p1  ORF type:complete len:686 (-),score=132.30 Plantae.Rhodophyta-Hildenbrandia_rubra.ctg13639:535-2592(-)
MESDLDLLASDVRSSVARNGIEKALVDNAEKVAQCALDSPHDFERLVAEWMYQDPETRKLMPSAPKGTDLTKLSFQEARSLRKVTDIDWPSSPESETQVEDRSIIGKIGEVRDKVRTKLGISSSPIKGVVESNGKAVAVYREDRFLNWGRTVEARPEYTFAPQSVVGVQNIVRFAKREGLRVRVAASRHSWSSVFGKNGEVLIALAPKKFAEGGGLHPENPQDVELEAIKFVGERKDNDGREIGLVRIGASATSDHFRAWALREGSNGGNRKWAMRALPVLVEITFGGNISMLCHGSGISSKTTSDLVEEIEFVNARGEVQTVKDPAQLQAAAGCFGLLGIITAITFRVEPLTYANFFPKKIPTLLAVPPLPTTNIPRNQSDFRVDGFAEDELKKSRSDFVADANKYYSEWFWFPFQSECWLNSWDNDGKPDPSGAIYPDAKEVKNQNAQAALGHSFEQTLLRLLPPLKQARILASISMAVLPAGEPLPTPTTEALHFRRGVHRLPVLDMEIEIPLPAQADDPTKPDLSIAQDAWWMAIEEVYGQLPRAPMRTTLEMRIIGDSDAIMSTQRGNKLGTCSIEILTNLLTDRSEWKNFKQAVLDRWASLKDPVSGEPLKIRPHWAKEWEGLSVRGMPVEEYLKTTAYAAEIPLFKERLAEVAKSGGHDISDSYKLFGNDLMSNILSI